MFMIHLLVSEGGREEWREREREREKYTSSLVNHQCSSVGYIEDMYTNIIVYYAFRLPTLVFTHVVSTVLWMEAVPISPYLMKSTVVCFGVSINS